MLRVLQGNMNSQIYSTRTTHQKDVLCRRCCGCRTDTAAAQSLMDHFSQACKDWNSLKKTNVLCQDVVTPAIITIDNNELESVYQFTYSLLLVTAKLWTLTATDTHDKHPSLLLSCLGELTTDAKQYSAQRLRHKYTALWQWTLGNIRQTRDKVQHHMWRILGVCWRDKIPNTEVLSCASLSSMYAFLRQSRFRWFGLVWRMQYGRIIKVILYSVRSSDRMTVGRVNPCYKGVCKPDIRALYINLRSWEEMAADGIKGRGVLRNQVRAGE